MITERVIAEKFTVIWRQHFPLLTPSFMKVFNDTQIKTINRHPIPVKKDVRNDLVSEIAFNASQKIIENDLQPSLFLRKDKILPIAVETAKNLWRVNKISEEEIGLTESEMAEIISLAKNIIEFIFKMGAEDCEFKPVLKGYGILSNLVADVSIGDTLYEFKTVQDNFRSSHLKQIFLYLALQQVTGDICWQNFGLYNPRKGTFCKLNIRATVYELSGGKTPNEVFKDLLDSLTRDMTIDSRF